MDKTFTFAGIGVFILELVLLLVFLLATKINWTMDIFLKTILVSGIILINLIGIFLIIYGLIKEKEWN